MEEFENSNDVTKDIEISGYKQNSVIGFDDLANTSRDTENGVHIGHVDVIGSSGTKVLLSVYGNDLRIKNPSKIGNVFSFLYVNGYPHITIGPQYYMSIILFSCINFVNALLIYFIYKELHFTIKYSGLILYILQVFSQVYTTLINPGIPHRNNYVSDPVMHTIYQNVKHNNYKFDKYRVCKRCNILVTVEQEVTHCEDCNICVEDLDHHCVWIGKCIAKKNLWSFNVFIVTTMLFGLFSILSVMILVIANVTRKI